MVQSIKRTEHRLKDVLEVSFGDSNAVIPYGNLHCIFGFRHFKVDLTAVWGELDGVE